MDVHDIIVGHILLHPGYERPAYAPTCRLGSVRRRQRESVHRNPFRLKALPHCV